MTGTSISALSRPTARLRVLRLVWSSASWAILLTVGIVMVVAGGGERVIWFWVAAVLMAGAALFFGSMLAPLGMAVGLVMAAPLLVGNKIWPHRWWDTAAGGIVQALGVATGAAGAVSVWRSEFPWHAFSDLWLASSEPVAAASALGGLALFALSVWVGARVAERAPTPVADGGMSSRRAAAPAVAEPPGSPASAPPRPATARRPSRALVDPAPEPDEEFWSPTAIEAWRAWRWDGNRLHGMLVPWPSARLKAICSRGHETPGWDCGCGIYAVKDPAHIPRFGLGAEAIYGRVELSGLVIEHEAGYRAQVATITHLWVTEPSLQDVVQAAYPTVDVRVLEGPVEDLSVEGDDTG